MHSISSKRFFLLYWWHRRKVSVFSSRQPRKHQYMRSRLSVPHSQPASPPTEIFFQDHFLKELRYQAQLGNQAFSWFVYNSTLTSPQLVEVRWGGGHREGNIFVTCTRKTNGKSSINPIFFVVFTGNNITLSRCAPFKVVSDVEAVQGTI